MLTQPVECGLGNVDTGLYEPRIILGTTEGERDLKFEVLNNFIFCFPELDPDLQPLESLTLNVTKIY